MFRIADIQQRSVTSPAVRALLYTWGPHRQGRLTAEGERVPVTVHELPLTGLDPALLLPVTLEHTVDERSPLWGQTQHSLEVRGWGACVCTRGRPREDFCRAAMWRRESRNRLHGTAGRRLFRLPPKARADPNKPLVV